MSPCTAIWHSINTKNCLAKTTKSRHLLAKLYLLMSVKTSSPICLVSRTDKPLMLEGLSDVATVISQLGERVFRDKQMLPVTSP